MNLSSRSGRAGSIVLIALVLGALLVYPAVRSTYGATPSTFVTSPAITSPNGLAGRPDFLLVTAPTCQTEGFPAREVRKIDRNGANTLFSTLFVHDGCRIEHIAVAPGFGTFLPKYVYVTQGRKIIEILPDGSSKKVVFEFPSTYVETFSDSDNGITFDIFGTWNHDAIVVVNRTTGGEVEVTKGQVWRFRRATTGCPMSIGAPCLIPTGAPTFPATLEIVDGEFTDPVKVGGPPAVVPSTFGACPGGVLVASTEQTGGSVFCVMPNGAFSQKALWPGARGVHFVPPNPISFHPTDSPTGGTFFTAINNQNAIKQFPPTDFTSPPQASPGLDGRTALVTSEGGGIGRFDSTLTSVVTLPVFQSNGSFGNVRGADFTARNLTKIQRIPNTPAPQGKIPVAILSRPGFSPFTMINRNRLFTCGRIGNERSVPRPNDSGHRDVNRDGIIDLVIHCDGKIAGPPPWYATGWLLPNSPDEGFAGGE